MQRPSALVVAAMLGCAACAHPDLALPQPGVSFSRPIVVNGHRLTIHMADARTDPHRGGPLLVYATGDRGWAGKDFDVFRRLVSWGYPVAGFDAHDYVEHLRPAPTTTPSGVAAAYAAILQAAMAGLDLPPATPIVLVGVSRGADLSVVAAGQPMIRDKLAGVVVMGLTREEEYVHWYQRLDRHHAPAMIELYAYLPRLRTLPVTVIQSTHDSYLPASDARTLFGPDSPGHTLVPIPSRNHSFGGARDELYRTLREALADLSRMHS